MCSGWSYPIQAEGALLLGGVPPAAQLSGMDGEVGASLVRIDGVLGLAVVSAALQKLHKCVTQNTTELLQDTEGTSSTTAAWTGPQSGTGGDSSPPQDLVLEGTAVVSPPGPGTVAHTHTHRPRRDPPPPGSADRLQRWNTGLDAGEPTQASTSGRDALS